jgi:DNA primase
LEEREPLRPLSESQREALEEAVTRYQAALTVDAIAYLVDRGLTKETAATFRLGSVVDPMPGHGKFQGFLAIPYLIDTHPVSIRFRCIQSHDHDANYHGKYMSMAEEPARMFNARAIDEAEDEIHLTEGEFDAIILNQAGYPAVAIPGVHNWMPRHMRMLAGFSRVYVWADPDDAGAEFAARVARALRSAKVLQLRNGDVSDTYLTGGAEALKAVYEGRRA